MTDAPPAPRGGRMRRADDRTDSPMPSPHRFAALSAVLLLALVTVGPGGPTRAEPKAAQTVGSALKARQMAQANEAKFHRFETGQSFLLLSRGRRQLYIRGLVDMIYYVYLQQGAGGEGKEALRTCLGARSAKTLEQRFRNYLRRFPKLWDQPAASLFWATIQRTCGVKGVQN
ncbi:MAG: hypothetical protein ABFS30_06400 [Pseudomonadota bacterium]